MEVVYAPAGHQLHRVGVVRALCRRGPLGALEAGASVKARGSMIGGRHVTTGGEVMPVRLTLIVIGHEVMVHVETVGPVRRFVGARPLDARTVAKLVVAQPRVIAWPATRAFPPGVERSFG
jgi:hypothetical protein